MKRACFITGTDTGVGKTTIAASLARGFHKIGIRVGVMKPVETGCELRAGGTLVGPDAALLREAADADTSLEVINPYSFIPPISPGLAARQAGVDIDFETIEEAYEKIERESDVIVVEGAGGLLSPLGDDKVVADLVAYMKIPLLIVAPTRIGVINQCSLTVSAARQRGLPIQGIVLNHPEPPDEADRSLDSNPGEVEVHTGEEVLGVIPYDREKAPYVNVKNIIKTLISRDFTPTPHIVA